MINGNGNGKVLEDLIAKIRSGTPMVQIVTSEAAIIDIIDQISRTLPDDEKRGLFCWHFAKGFEAINLCITDKNVSTYGFGDSLADYERLRVSTVNNPQKALQYIEDNILQAVFALVAFDNFWSNPQIKTSLQWLIDHHLEKTRKTIIVISSQACEIPPELISKVAVIDWPLPDETKIEGMISDMINVANLPISDGGYGLSVDLSDQHIERMVLSLKGLPEHAIMRSLRELIARGDFDETKTSITILEKHKRDLIGKDQALEYIKTDVEMGDVGGLDVLKTYLDEVVAVIQSPHAKAMGATIPSGILLVGPPGTGKTHTSRAIANRLNWPLLRLNIGAVFGPLVGQSEKQMMTVLSVIRAVAPVVIQLDEFEKSMGVSGDRDGGTSNRVMAQLLTWMQDHQDAHEKGLVPPIFMVATANIARALDAALMRRFDSTWLVDFPSLQERHDILSIHLKAKGYDPHDFLGVVNDFDNYSGAEIKKGVEGGIRKAIYRSIVKNSDPVLVYDDLYDALSEVVPVHRFMNDQVSAMQAMANMARHASSQNSEMTQKGKAVTPSLIEKK